VCNTEKKFLFWQDTKTKQQEQPWDFDTYSSSRRTASDFAAEHWAPDCHCCSYRGHDCHQCAHYSNIPLLRAKQWHTLPWYVIYQHQQNIKITIKVEQYHSNTEYLSCLKENITLIKLSKCAETGLTM